MTITERDRHDLLVVLEQTLGKEAAMTLAEHLPPVGWADVATRADLEHLAAHMDHRFEMIEQRFEMIEQRFEMIEQRFEMVDGKMSALEAGIRGDLAEKLAAQTRVLYLSIVTTVITILGISFLGH